MNIADELSKLQELHETGALSDEEFAEAKRAVLGVAPAARLSEGDNEGFVGEMLGRKNDTLGEAANRYVSFQMIMAGIGLIGFLLFFFLFFLPQLKSFPGM